MTIFAVPRLTPPRLRAVQAILVYEDLSENGTDCALLAHRIEQNKHGLRLGTGRHFGPADQQALLDILLGSTGQQSAYLPPEVIAHGSGRVAWYVSGCRRPMWFRMPGRESFHVDVPWPTLLFSVLGQKVHLAALARATRPEADTPVYHAPLMNVHANTSLCAGNAILPHSASLRERRGYEVAVFNTNFTHCNHEHTLARPAGAAVSNAEHLRFYRRLESSGSPQFPDSALVPLGLSVSQWLAQSLR
jgi:PRTRC genetic system protein B